MVINEPVDVNKIIEDFFTDPKNSRQSAFLKGVVKKIIAEQEHEKEQNKPKEKSFLQELFDNNSIPEDK